MKKTFGFVYLGLLALTVLFQMAVLFGAPVGAFTQGGAVSGELGPAGKANAGISALILLLFGLIIARKSEILPARHDSKIINIGFWVLLVFSTLETFLNWFSPSDLERMVWGPVNTVLLVCVIGIARLSRRK